MTEEYGLVLAGGGCRGIYQLGVWRALREMAIPITSVVGTSVGAMNGALVVLDAYEEAVELWRNMSIEAGFDLSVPLREPENLFSLRNADILAKELWRGRGLDITPLRRRLEQLIDEETMRASSVQYGLVTFQPSRVRAHHLYLDQIPHGKLLDYVMASAAYPGLKRQVIDGTSYMDGGIVDNLPIKMMLERHKDNLIVVNIGQTGVPRDLDPELHLLYIKPIDPLGKAFEFRPEDNDSKMEMGWYDAMKAFDKFHGDWMYFPPAEYQRLRDELGDRTVTGLEYAARLYGMDKLRVCMAEPFVRELLECDRVSAEKFRTFRSRIEFHTLLKEWREMKEYNPTSDLLLQCVQALLEEEKEHTRMRSMAVRVFPDLLCAAEAVVHLRRYVYG